MGGRGVRTFLLGLGALVLLPLAVAAPAQQARAEGAPPIGLELNRLESMPQGCRAWLMLRNPGAEALDPLRLDLVLFGRDGVVARRLAVDVGPLPAAKTMAKVFDIAGLGCDRIGAVLLNDLLACGPDAAARAACLARLGTSSRVPEVSFDK